MIEKITVLMTVYNGGEYLRSAIKSVINQTYRDFEFLVINDCSTDDSLEVIKSFDDNRVVIYNNEINIGQTKSLNIGFNKASGDYIARIDADDIAFPNWIDSQVAYLKKNSDCVILSSGLVTIDVKNNIKKIHMSLEKREDVLLRAIINSPINHGSSLMKKEVVLSAGGYKEQYKIAADYGLWVELIRKGCNIKSNPDILMAVRRHDESASQLGRRGQGVVEISKIINQHIGFVSKIHLLECDAELLCRAHYDEGALSEEEFSKALDVHNYVYKNINLELNIDNSYIKSWRTKQAETFYLRRIYSFFVKEDFIKAREVCLSAIKEFGILSIFSALFISTLFRKLLLNLVIKFYEWFYRRKAIYKLGISKVV
ncbi:MAG: glycosyltransferase [Candidatus Zapsychrus exili]|nr:glycosyltransferase [Candidatus Zapsychrus exili]